MAGGYPFPGFNICCQENPLQVSVQGVFAFLDSESAGAIMPVFVGSLVALPAIGGQQETAQS